MIMMIQVRLFVERNHVMTWNKKDNVKDIRIYISGMIRLFSKVYKRFSPGMKCKSEHTAFLTPYLSFAMLVFNVRSL